MKDEALHRAQSAIDYTILALSNGNDLTYAKACLESALTAIKQARSAPVQEPVAWPCVIAEADFEKNTVTLEMQCSDYKVGAGRHWLHTTPPKQPVPVQEPVVMTFDEAYASLSWNEWRMRPIKELLAELHRLTTPPAAQRQWVGLTEDEIEECASYGYRYDVVAVTEDKLKEKNT